MTSRVRNNLPELFLVAIILCLAAFISTRLARQEPIPAKEASERRGEVGEGVPVDPRTWTHPLGPLGVAVQSAAKAPLAYPVDAPDSLPAPSSVTTTSPRAAGPLHREIGFAYNDPQVGRYVLVEDRVTYKESYLIEEAHLPPGCSKSDGDHSAFGKDAAATSCTAGDAKLIRLTNGSRGLLIAGPTVTSLTWLEPLKATGSLPPHSSIEMRLLGPADELSPSEAVAVANKV